MDWRVAKQNLYSLIALQAALTPKQPVRDETISRVNASLKLVTSGVPTRAPSACACRSRWMVA